MSSLKKEMKKQKANKDKIRKMSKQNIKASNKAISNNINQIIAI